MHEARNPFSLFETLPFLQDKRVWLTLNDGFAQHSDAIFMLTSQE